MRGFTLVEVMVAVGIAALLIVGVAGATQSTVRISERQKAESRQEERRSRAIELLRDDWRGRVRIVTTPKGSPRDLRLVTTSDSIVAADRAQPLVIYTASEKGLLRKERDLETLLLPGPVSMDFWDGVAWRPEPVGAQPLLRLTLTDRAEAVVLR